MTQVAVDSPDTTLATTLPVARGHWLLGNLGGFATNPLNALQAIAMEHGNAARIRFPFGSTYLFNDPVAYKRILQENAGNYIKSRSYHKMGEFLGRGLLTSEGDFWRRQRRLIQPAFLKDRLRELAARMDEEARRLRDEWQSRDGMIHLHTEMMRLTMRVVARSLFSYDVSGGAENKVDDAMEFIQQHIFYRTSTLVDLPSWIPTRRNRRYLAAVGDLDGIIYDMIARRRRGDAAEEYDLLQMLLDARDEDSGDGMDDKQVRDEIMTLFLAGHETTANALTFLLYVLASNPDVEARVLEEYESAFGEGVPTPEDLEKLEYTPRVIKEVLRLYPPAWVLERESVGEDVVAGFTIPKGAWIFLCTYALHRTPEFWPEPDRFDPDRFLPEAERARPRYAWVPFGGGPRQCIGLAFAMMEMQIALPVLLRSFRMRLPTDAPLALMPQITLRPRGTVPMHIQPR